MNHRRVHDGIVGAVILVTTVLGYFYHAAYLYIPMVIAALMVQSAFTGFCPVYFILGKLYPSKAS